jgi:hypothetical protein
MLVLGRLSAVRTQSVRKHGYGDGGGLYLRVAPGGTSWIKAKPDPAAVIADLKVLESKLSNAFEAKADYPNAMQDRYTVALTAVANFLTGAAGIDEEIAHKFIELASAMREGNLPFLHPPETGGRTYDSQAKWNYRSYVVIGLECILKSKKMKLQEAARYIAKKYPIFNRLKRNPSDCLEKSIIAWRRYFADGTGYEYLRVASEKFYQPCDPAEMFERAKRALRAAAENTAKAAPL